MVEQWNIPFLFKSWDLEQAGLGVGTTCYFIHIGKLEKSRTAVDFDRNLIACHFSPMVLQQINIFNNKDLGNM
jgi:hypothetical protein